MEPISVKLDERFLRRLEVFLRKHHYTTKAEFIREAIRERIKQIEKEETLARVRKIYGASKKKKKTTDEELHEAGKEVFEELEKEFSLK
jgi:metal-responsive CopG/Arc/MetJ family transcriptional regulator